MDSEGVNTIYLTTITFAFYGAIVFLVGFFLFVAFYIILRVLAERHEHKKSASKKAFKPGWKNEEGK